MNNNGTIISTRIRLARNIDGLPFPNKMSELHARRVIDGVSKSLDGVDKFSRFDMNRISPLDKAILIEKHLISPDLAESDYGAVLIDPDENVSIMVNEEDHIREQVILPGLSLDQAYDRINKIDDALSKNLKFAFSRRFGYLTSCATNLGTGLRASVMMFLPALTILKNLKSAVNAVSRLNMTVRGVYGEDSKADGFLHQISNQHTLGLKESEIIDSVRTAIYHISRAEEEARDILKRNEPEIKDNIMRAWGVATNAYTISADEAMRLLAMIKLGDYYGYINISDEQVFQKLITHIQPANMQFIGGRNMEPQERDILRARYISANLTTIAKRNNL
ncbi:MAG: protein arginine kinase [Clostridiales bacterium]|nr:protein arginine kinase [Clostridiales bacterium]